tara:strand:- start:223 stop:474 length:252 start_codon:yes stop_codon:yes gene_type:complete
LESKALIRREGRYYISDLTFSDDHGIVSEGIVLIGRSGSPPFLVSHGIISFDYAESHLICNTARGHTIKLDLLEAALQPGENM